MDTKRLREMADAAPPGLPGGVPLLTRCRPRCSEPCAAAKSVAREDNDLELHPSSYDARRLLASLETLNRRGMTPYLVLAVHEASGAVAALTEVVVPAQHPVRADQYDTIVVPGAPRPWPGT